LIVIGSLLGMMAVFLLLFWLAFPRWWPEVVIRYSPSLGHVLLADSYRAENGGYRPGVSASLTRPGIVITRESSDYHRFEQHLGDGIYQAMAACDDGLHGRIRQVILNYCGWRLHHPKARAVLWAFSDAGDDAARRIVYRHVDTTPQRVDAATVEERQRRPVP
jgi:hypothetical protein